VGGTIGMCVGPLVRGWYHWYVCGTIGTWVVPLMCCTATLSALKEILPQASNQLRPLKDGVSVAHHVNYVIEATLDSRWAAAHFNKSTIMFILHLSKCENTTNYNQYSSRSSVIDTRHLISERPCVSYLLCMHTGVCRRVCPTASHRLPCWVPSVNH